MKLIKFAVFLPLIFMACNPDKLDTKAIKEEMNKHKIKRITEGEILSEADFAATAIIDSIQGEINKNLDSALKSGNIGAALPFCMISNLQLLKSLETKHAAKIYRAGFPDKLRNPSNMPDSFQTMVLDGYKYNIEHGLALGKDITMNEEEIIFNNPIILNEKSCLRCHGTVGKDLNEKEYKEILEKYPKDRSIGMKQNDPMGIWTVRFKKDVFIRNMQ